MAEDDRFNNERISASATIASTATIAPVATITNTNDVTIVKKQKKSKSKYVSNLDDFKAQSCTSSPPPPADATTTAMSFDTIQRSGNGAHTNAQVANVDFIVSPSQIRTNNHSTNWASDVDLSSRLVEKPVTIPSNKPNSAPIQRRVGAKVHYADPLPKYTPITKPPTSTVNHNSTETITNNKYNSGRQSNSAFGKNLAEMIPVTAIPSRGRLSNKLSSVIGKSSVSNAIPILTKTSDIGRVMAEILDSKATSRQIESSKSAFVSSSNTAVTHGMKFRENLSNVTQFPTAETTQSNDEINEKTPGNESKQPQQQEEKKQQIQRRRFRDKSLEQSDSDEDFEIRSRSNTKKPRKQDGDWKNKIVELDMTNNNSGPASAGAFSLDALLALKRTGTLGLGIDGDSSSINNDNDGNGVSNSQTSTTSSSVVNSSQNNMKKSKAALFPSKKSSKTSLSQSKNTKRSNNKEDKEEIIYAHATPEKPAIPSKAMPSNEKALFEKNIESFSRSTTPIYPDSHSPESPHYNNEDAVEEVTFAEFLDDHDTEDGKLKWSGLDVMRGDAVFAYWKHDENGSDISREKMLIEDDAGGEVEEIVEFRLYSPPLNPQPPPLLRSAFFTRLDPQFLTCMLKPNAISTNAAANTNIWQTTSQGEDDDDADEESILDSAADPYMRKQIYAALEHLKNIIVGTVPSPYMDAWRRQDTKALHGLVYSSGRTEPGLVGLVSSVEEKGLERAIATSGNGALEFPDGCIGDGFEEALRRDRLICYVLLPEGVRMIAKMRREELDAGIVADRDWKATGKGGGKSSSAGGGSGEVDWVRRMLTLRESLSLGKKVRKLEYD
ncbi:hypothetical protein HK100_012220 [Physocladia obscura]|uniref:Uncharacterized protein n=1 Tax=Physocladia obscura TaxID=109957 RepID=A0AAD5XGE6_9FUNG|nr:hypothetical protein HK100_012220 [Physocladia obscura]